MQYALVLCDFEKAFRTYGSVLIYKKSHSGACCSSMFYNKQASHYISANWYVRYWVQKSFAFELPKYLVTRLRFISGDSQNSQSSSGKAPEYAGRTHRYVEEVSLKTPCLVILSAFFKDECFCLTVCQSRHPFFCLPIVTIFFFFIWCEKWLNTHTFSFLGCDDNNWLMLRQGKNFFKA